MYLAYSANIEAEMRTGDTEKLQSQTEAKNNRTSKNKYGYYQRGRYRQYNRW